MQSKEFYEFGPYRLYPAARVLLRDGANVALTPKVLDTLKVLVENAGQPLSKEELLRSVWPETFVEESNLAQNISVLRKALGTARGGGAYIETIAKRGYRFVAEVRLAPAVQAPAASETEPAPEPAASTPLSGSSWKVFDLEGIAVTSAPPSAAARKRRWPPVVATLFALAAVAGAWWLGHRSRTTAPARFQRLTFRRGIVQAARFAPDGRSVIYGAAWEGRPVELFSVDLATPESSRPLGFSSTGIRAIASTGEMAVCTACAMTRFGSDGNLGQMPLASGAPREFLEGVRAADWTPDGKQLAAVMGIGDNRSLTRLEFPIGKVLFKGQPNSRPVDVRVSPQGDMAAFAEYRFPQGDNGSITVVDLQGHSKRLTRLFNSLQGLAWAPNGKEIWFTAATEGSIRALYAVTLSGALRLIAQMPTNLMLQDIAADGRVLLTRVDSRSSVFLVGPSGSGPRDMTWLDWATDGVLSPDGKSICMTESGSGAAGVYLRGTDGSPAAHLDGGFTAPISFSPDGKWVAALTNLEASELRLGLLPVKAGKPVALNTGTLKFRIRPNKQQWIFWFPDSERIMFPAMEPARPIRSWVQSIHGGPPSPVTPEGVNGLVLTPDGTTLLARDSESKAWLFPLNGGAPKLLPFLTQDYTPMRFTADGRSLYALRQSENPPKIWRIDLGTGRREIERELPYLDPAGFTAIAGIQITSDGKSLVYTFRRVLSELYLVEGLR